MTTYLFPGQGAQKKGMGIGLFEKYAELTELADAILGYSVRQLCEIDANNQLNLTEFTQPALYVVNAFSYYERVYTHHEKVQFVAGHSLGEYNALLAANVFDFATGLKLVKKRGELMGRSQGGAMAAIIGLTINDIKTILEKQKLKGVEVANENSFNQTVIAGPEENILQAQNYFKEAGALMIVLLPVSGAFHSSYMSQAALEFRDYLEDFVFARPEISVISNYTAKPYPYDEIKNFLTKQITHTVRWTESMLYLQEQGEKNFVELGPGNTLTKLLRRIQHLQ